MFNNQSDTIQDEENLLPKTAKSAVVSASSLTDTIYYHPKLRYPIATLFSLGKLFQAAGQDTLGILKLLVYFHSRNQSLNDSILAPLVTINAFINLSTRANKIFEYCLLPKVYWTVNLSQLNLEELEIKKSYIIDQANYTLHYVDIDTHRHRKIHLRDAGQRQLTQLVQKVVDDQNFASSERTIREISQYFSADSYDQFYEINKKRELPPNWEWTTKLLYTFLYGGCAISTVFSGATAYLSGVTLAKACYSKLPKNVALFIGSYVALCAIIAYISFNVKTMRGHVKNTCDSFNSGMYLGNFNIPVRAMRWTLVTTSLGVLASAGMAYFSMKNAVKVLPWVKDLPENAQETLIYINVIISFFPSIFNFAAGCYTQLKKVIPEKAEENISIYQHLSPFSRQLNCATLALTFCILIDSTANSFGTFLGTEELLEKFFNPHESATNSQVLLAITLLITTSNIFLNFGMTMTGTEEAFQVCNQCIYGRNKNVMYAPLLNSTDPLIESNEDEEDDLRRKLTTPSWN